MKWEDSIFLLNNKTYVAMKCYQIFYNSAAETLDGSTGFGVTSVTEGTPADFIRLIDTSTYLRSYNSGKFDFDDPSLEMSEHPEKIYEYPKKYLYAQVKADGKDIYLIERVVNTVFDHDFYSTGEASRSGNYVAHVFMFDEFPGKEVFNLLYEAPSDGSMRFLPADWTPKKDNQELVSLMIEKPRQLPAADPVFGSRTPDLRKESVDLFFSYRESMLSGLPMVVSMPESDARIACAGMMSILPEDVVRQATFVLNHQSKGYSMNVKISFVNEFYPFPVYEAVCHHVDFFKEKRAVGALEIIWRTPLEQAISAGDVEARERLAAWIYGDMAAKLKDRPADLNIAVFDYCCKPSVFGVEMIDGTEGILPVILDAVSMQLATPSRLMELLCNEFISAKTLDDYAEAIRLTEKVGSVGFDMSVVVETARNVFTAYLLACPSHLTEAVSRIEKNLLRKYAVAESFPTLAETVSGSLNCTLENIIRMAAFLEDTAVERVKVYVRLLRENPSEIQMFTQLLNSDRVEAEKVDYLTEFKDYLNDDRFALFFYGQIMRERHDVPVGQSLKKYHDMAVCNQRFAQELFSNLRIYDELYAELTSGLSKDRFAEVSALAQEHVLAVIPDSSVRRKWQLLRDVLSAEPSEDVPGYYSLAVIYDADEAIRKIAPRCFGELSVIDAKSVVAKLKEKNALTDKQMLEAAASCKGGDGKGWLIAVAREYKYDYDAIAEASKAFGINSLEDLKAFMTEHFKKEYSAYRRRKFMEKVRSLFNKKGK